MGNFMKRMAVLLVLTAALFIAVPVSAEAKAANNKLKVNQTYTKYDITGDKKADTLLISGNWNQQYGGYVGYEVYVNGKSALKKKSGYGLDYSIGVRRNVLKKSNKYGPIYSLDIRRLELQNGKTFLSIVPGTYNDDVPGAAIYQYKDGKLKQVIDLNAMSKIGFHNSIGSIKVSGNKITVKYRVMSYSLGGISFSLDYQYKNGKMVQKTTNTKVSETIINYQKKTYWTANKTMKVLKSPGGKKTATLVKGKKVKIDRIYINMKHNQIYLHVKIKGGKSGWVKGLTKYPSKTLFKEVMYAG